MEARLYKPRAKRFAHEMILDGHRGQHKAYCRCGQQSPTSESPQMVIDWYQSHLSRAGVREQKRRVVEDDE